MKRRRPSAPTGGALALKRRNIDGDLLQAGVGLWSLASGDFLAAVSPGDVVFIVCRGERGQRRWFVVSVDEGRAGVGWSDVWLREAT